MKIFLGIIIACVTIYIVVGAVASIKEDLKDIKDKFDKYE